MSGSARDIRELLASRGIALKKRWGQNFLVDPGARARIIRVLDPRPGDTVWEIGGGTGALTAELSGRCSRLVVFEVDHGLASILDELLRDRSGASVVRGDFCRSWTEALGLHGAPDLVVGNLPYRSASRMVAVLAGGAGLEPRRVVLTVQKELGQRMTASPSTKAYSSFSVLCQARFRVRAQGDLAPGAFFPVPRVTSRVVLLEPIEAAGGGPCRELGALQAVTRLLFSTRRKTIRRTVRDCASRRLGLAIERGLEELGIALEKRPEALSVGDYRRLSLLVARELGEGAPETDFDPGAVDVENAEGEADAGTGADAAEARGPNADGRKPPSPLSGDLP